MEIFLTNIQKLNHRVPTRLDLLRELNHRKALVGDGYLLKELKRLDRGAAGEKILLDYLEKYGEDHWKILKNVWIDSGGFFERDLLLLTSYALYVFEVKNYSGTFELKHNIGRINGTKYSKHPITQGQNLVFNLEKILKETAGKMKVKDAVPLLAQITL